MLLARPVERGRAAELACPFLTATGDLALRMLSDSPPMLLVVLTALVFFRRTLCAFAFGRAGVPVEVAFTLAALALSLCTAFCSAWACRGVVVGLGLGLACVVFTATGTWHVKAMGPALAALSWVTISALELTTTSFT